MIILRGRLRHNFLKYQALLNRNKLLFWNIARSFEITCLKWGSSWLCPNHPTQIVRIERSRPRSLEQSRHKPHFIKINQSIQFLIFKINFGWSLFDFHCWGEEIQNHIWSYFKKMKLSEIWKWKRNFVVKGSSKLVRDGKIKLITRKEKWENALIW